jgi:NitT/TauT family transport system permease protein
MNRTMKRIIKKNLIELFKFLFPFFVVIILWELFVDIGLISQVPSPYILFMRFVQITFEKNILASHLKASVYRLLIGYLLAAILGIAMGTLMGIKKYISEMFSPALSLLIAIPTIAWVPILLITLGLGDETVITAIFLGGFFAIAYSTMHGIRTVNKSHINAAKTMGSNKRSLFLHVLLPGSLISLLPGLRLAIGYSWRALIGAEMLAALVKWGIGKMIYSARFFNDVELMFVGLIIIGIAGLILDHLVMGTIEKWTIERWGMIQEG